MAHELSTEEAEKALRGLSIPPRPTVLTQLTNEVRREAPNLRTISGFIASDVGLSAAVLKTVNSPFFGLPNKIGSMQQAVSLLGVRNITTLATGLLLRNAVGGDKVSLERFWDSAEKVAQISAYVASTLPRISRDDAYTFGLFHDCGMPVLMQKFPDYKETLRLANGSVDRPMTEVEDERHATNHATVGYLLSRAWYLPDAICEAIMRHHDMMIFTRGDHVSPAARTLIAVVLLAEQIHDEVLRMRNSPQWDSLGEHVLAHLGLDQAEYIDLKEEVLNMND